MKLAILNLCIGLVQLLRAYYAEPDETEDNLITVLQTYIGENGEGGMKISTEYWMKPIPLREWDWSAIDSDTYDVDCDQDGFFSNSPVGYGATEDEAIQDLKDQIQDREDELRIAQEEDCPFDPDTAEMDRLAFERQHAWGKP